VHLPASNATCAHAAGPQGAASRDLKRRLAGSHRSRARARRAARDGALRTYAACGGRGGPGVRRRCGLSWRVLQCGRASSMDTSLRATLRRERAAPGSRDTWHRCRKTAPEFRAGRRIPNFRTPVPCGRPVIVGVPYARRRGARRFRIAEHRYRAARAQSRVGRPTTGTPGRSSAENVSARRVRKRWISAVPERTSCFTLRAGTGAGPLHPVLPP
jgi:hypothetical protein